MPQEQIITAIDIGTDKCVTLIAKHLPESGNLQVIGVSAVPSKGMKRSQIIDLEKVVNTVSESLDAAERMAGFEVRSAWMSVGGPRHVHSLNSKGVVAVASPQQEISPEDVARVIEAARAVSLPADTEIIHVIPNTYKVDSQEDIRDPIGMVGIRLEADVHVIAAKTPVLRNATRVMENLGLQVDGFVFAGLSASGVILTETEKELGVVLIDIGAGSTSICAYVDGSLRYSGSVPIGAHLITQDIAVGCQVSMDIAEKIKLSLSNESFKPMKPLTGESKQDFSVRRRKADELRLAELSNDEHSAVLSKKTLVDGIIAPRVVELFSLIHEQLEKERILTQLPAGLVIVGGGAETVGLLTLAKQHFKLPARIGAPTEMDGLTLDITKPSYAGSVGLLEYARLFGEQKANGGFELASLFSNLNPGSITKKIKQIFQNLMP